MKKALIISLYVGLTSGCMDVNPPKRGENDEMQILHSIQLPHSKAVYAVGDADSINAIGLLITGDTLDIPIEEIVWRFVPATSAITIDSSGRLGIVATSTTLSNSGVNLIATYTLGEVVKADTMRIYVTQDRYEISKFKLTFPDTNQGGAFTLSQFQIGLVSYQDFTPIRFEIEDADGRTLPQLNFNNHLTRFLGSFQSGLRLPSTTPIMSTATYPTNLHIRTLVPPGEYWIGLEAYMYGRVLRDSVQYRVVSAAEIFFQGLIISGSKSLSRNSAVVQPCSIVMMRNALPDTVVLTLPRAEIECNGSIPTDTVFVIPPGVTRRLRSLGLPTGREETWNATIGIGNSGSITSGPIRVK